MFAAIFIAIMQAFCLHADVFDSADIELLESRIFGLEIEPFWLPDEMFDLNNDELVNANDVRTWVVEVSNTLLSDADLNGKIEFADFLVLAENFGQAGSWKTGDFDTSGYVQFPDFLLLSKNFGKASDNIAPVSEPTSATLATVFFLSLLSIRKRRSRIGSL